MPFNLRPLLFTLHLYLAVAVGLYIAMLGVTGAILAFETEIDLLAHANLAYVTPAPPRLSLAELGEAVAKAYPGQKINHYDMGEAPNLATRVYVSADTRTGDMLVYVNPYTGQILGSRTDAGVLGFIHSFHQRLTPPRPGRDDRTKAFISWISVAALFLLVSGIWLWWPRMRFGIGAGGGRAFWYDVHATLGVAAVAFMVLLTTTGILMGFGSTTRPMLYALTGSQPTPPPKIPPPPADATQAISVDRALVIAGDAVPGAKPVAISVANARAYFVLIHPPGDSFYLGQVTVDKYTGAVLAAGTPATRPAGDRLAVLIATIHRGDVFGIPSKVIMALASLIIALQAVSGAVMWIKRTPFRSMIPALVATAVVTAIAVYTVLVPTG
ncbi:MAG: PepSY-associated TM helix domain-containing protein [Rhodospirillaceae bacterium]